MEAIARLKNKRITAQFSKYSRKKWLKLPEIATVWELQPTFGLQKAQLWKGILQEIVTKRNAGLSETSSEETCCWNQKTGPKNEW